MPLHVVHVSTTLRFVLGIIAVFMLLSLGMALMFWWLYVLFTGDVP